MTAMHLDYCRGCEVPLSKRVTLPKDWKHGDPIPPEATVHSTIREPRKFVFLYGSRERAYLDGDLV